MIFNPKENLILQTLDQPEFGFLAPHLKLISLTRGQALLDIGEKINYIYFPITCIASLLCSLEDGTSVELGTIGNEGFVGVAALTGDRALNQTVIVKMDGYCYRISVKLLQSIFEASEGSCTKILKKLMLRYTGALFNQVSQATACIRHHNIEQQLCCWLLLSFDRVSSNNLAITQETVAHLLGVRRESVSEIVKKLRQARIINNRRTHFELRDKEELEARVCECYAIIKGESEHLIKDFQLLKLGNKIV